MWEEQVSFLMTKNLSWLGFESDRIWVSRKIIACKILPQFSIEHEIVDGGEGIDFLWSTKRTSFIG